MVWNLNFVDLCSCGQCALCGWWRPRCRWGHCHHCCHSLWKNYFNWPKFHPLMGNILNKPFATHSDLVKWSSSRWNPLLQPCFYWRSLYIAVNKEQLNHRHIFWCLELTFPPQLCVKFSLKFVNFSSSCSGKQNGMFFFLNISLALAIVESFPMENTWSVYCILPTIHLVLYVISTLIIFFLILAKFWPYMACKHFTSRFSFIVYVVTVIVCYLF